MDLRSAVTLSALAIARLFAQAPPSFEVASVKPAAAQGRAAIYLFTYPGGRIVVSAYTLKQLIHDAYDVEDYRITGGPQWADEDRFNVEAKPPESSEATRFVPASPRTPPNPEMRLMLRTLLADRFQLKVHTEEKKEFVYALTVAKGGPRLKNTADATRQPFVSAGRTGAPTQEALSLTFTGQNATVALFVQRLAVSLGRPVIDQTGLMGNYDFTVEYGATDAQTNIAPPLVRALQDQLGLKLETQPGATSIIVIDHAEKPAAN